MEENKYITPKIEVIVVYAEGVLCASNETMDENDGIW
jgi:hypothetical protein